MAEQNQHPVTSFFGEPGGGGIAAKTVSGVNSALGLNGGDYRMFGASDEDIAAFANAQRRAGQEQDRYRFDRGLQLMAQNASGRGLGQSGAMAHGVPFLHRNVQMAGIEREAALMRAMAAMQNGRTFAYQPGLFEQALAGGMQIGGAYLAGGGGGGGVG